MVIRFWNIGIEYVSQQDEMERPLLDLRHLQVGVYSQQTAVGQLNARPVRKFLELRTVQVLPPEQEPLP